MSSSHASVGKLSLGGLATRILVIVVIWALLVAGILHYVGYVWPREIQISQAKQAEADERAKDAVNPPKPATAAPAAGTAPAATTTAATMSAPAAGSTTAKSTPAAGTAPMATTAAAPAAGTVPAATTAASASGTTPAAAKPAGTADKKLPYDERLAGFDRSAMPNVAIFHSIVVSVLSIGAILLQIFKYKHKEEEVGAH